MPGHQWAVSGAAITATALTERLTAYQQRHGLQSGLWLLPSHCPFFSVRPLPSVEPLEVPAAALLPAAPLAFPFALAADAVRRRVAEAGSAPQPLGGLPLVLSRGGATADGLRWRGASRAEYLDATLLADPRAGPGPLLVSPEVCVPRAPRRRATLPLLNAQDTSNPYRIDLALTHRSLAGGGPVAPEYASGLTTVAAQFGYRSLRWLEASELRGRGTALSPPHVVSAECPVDLIHVTQLAAATQQRLLESVPRFVLQHGMTTPFFYADGRWLSRSRCRLTRYITRRDMLLEEGCDPATQPLLWFVAAPGDGTVGRRLRCSRMSVRDFYNVEQLSLRADGAARDGAITESIEEDLADQLIVSL